MAGRAKSQLKPTVRAKPKTPPPVVKPKGRESSYHPSYVETVRIMAFAGWERKRIAEQLGVSVQTFYQWLKIKPGLLEALESADDLAHGKTAMSLFNRANGCTTVEVREGVHIDEETGERTLKPIARITRQQAPDTAAALAWLQNRQPDRWRQKAEVEHNVNLTVRRALLELED